MKIDRFLQLFVVKEKKFYPLYVEQAACIDGAAKLLLELLQEQDAEKQDRLYKCIKEYEGQGDVITAKLYEELNRTFVTPFDREDVNRLSSAMDTFLDLIQNSAKRMVMYRPKEVHQSLVRLGEYIEEDARIVKDMMSELEFLQKKPHEMNDKCLQIKRIEHEVDDLFEHFMSDVFANEKDAIELVKLKNIAQALEDATDRAKDIGDVVRGIIIKFA